MKDEFVLGDSNAICDTCGFKYKLSQLKKRWDGAMVCEVDWEPRHPQDLIRAIPERNKVVDARPDPDPQFVNPGDVTADDL